MAFLDSTNGVENNYESIENLPDAPISSEFCVKPNRSRINESQESTFSILSNQKLDQNAHKISEHCEESTFLEISAEDRSDSVFEKDVSVLEISFAKLALHAQGVPLVICDDYDPINQTFQNTNHLENGRSTPKNISNGYSGHRRRRRSYHVLQQPMHPANFIQSMQQEQTKNINFRHSSQMNSGNFQNNYHRYKENLLDFQSPQLPPYYCHHYHHHHHHYLYASQLINTPIDCDSITGNDHRFIAENNFDHLSESKSNMTRVQFVKGNDLFIYDASRNENRNKDLCGIDESEFRDQLNLQNQILSSESISTVIDTGLFEKSTEILGKESDGPGVESFHNFFVSSDSMIECSTLSSCSESDNRFSFGSASATSCSPSSSLDQEDDISVDSVLTSSKIGETEENNLRSNPEMNFLSSSQDSNILSLNSLPEASCELFNTKRFSTPKTHKPRKRRRKSCLSNVSPSNIVTNGVETLKTLIAKDRSEEDQFKHSSRSSIDDQFTKVFKSLNCKFNHFNEKRLPDLLCKIISIFYLEIENPH